MKAKKNPRNRPASQADVENAMKDGYEFGAEFALTLFLFIAAEDWGLPKDDIKKLRDRFDFYVKQAGKNELNYKEIHQAFIDDYGIEVSVHAGPKSTVSKLAKEVSNTIPNMPEYDQLYEFALWLAEWTLTIIPDEDTAKIVRDQMKKYGLI